jgi:hypothetical protein
MLHYVPMTSRMRTPIVRRPSLPLTERDERDLALLASSPEHREALARLSGLESPSSVSEAAVLHAVFEVGIATIRSAVEEASYALLAAEQASAAAQLRAEARRRTPSWAHEE